MNTSSKTKTKTITIRIDEDLHNALNQQASNQSKTTSNLIREILYSHNQLNHQSGNDELKKVLYEAEKMRREMTKAVVDSSKHLDLLNQYVEGTANNLNKLTDGVNKLDVTKIKRIGVMNVMSFVFFAVGIFVLLASSTMYFFK